MSDCYWGMYTHPFDEEEPDRSWWEQEMAANPQPFEGCVCDAATDLYEEGKSKTEVLTFEREYEGPYSEEWIAQYRCPFCGKEFRFYTTGEFKGHIAHESEW